MKTKFTVSLFACIAALTLLPTQNASAQIFVYDAFLSGPGENPPNASPGTGFSEVTINLTLHTLRVQVNFTGLTGTTTASHIHAPVLVPGGVAGVATQTPSFSSFPLGVTSGSMDQTLDMTLASSWNPAFITANGGTPAGAESALASSLANGTAYLNIHTSTFGGGEIRGFLLPVPEPATIGLLVVGGIGLVVAARKSRRS